MKFIKSPEVLLMLLLCSMMLIMPFVEMTKSASIEQMIKWFKLWMLSPRIRDKWGHWAARITIKSKRKLGLGTQKGKKKTPKI